MWLVTDVCGGLADLCSVRCLSLSLSLCLPLRVTCHLHLWWVGRSVQRKVLVSVSVVVFTSACDLSFALVVSWQICAT